MVEVPGIIPDISLSGSSAVGSDAPFQSHADSTWNIERAAPYPSVRGWVSTVVAALMS
jgi:hypothetical protein